MDKLSMLGAYIPVLSVLRHVRASVGIAVLCLLGGCQVSEGSPAPDTREARGPSPLPLHACALMVTSEDWDRLHRDVHRDVEVDASFRFNDLEVLIELELQGSSTLVYPKRSLKLKFNRQAFVADPFHEGAPEHFDKLILKAMYKDQSLMREALSFAVARHMGQRAPRVDWCELTLNGQYHGLFAIVEPINAQYLARQGFAPDGDLYKAVAQKADFDPETPLAEGFEKKLGDNSDWSKLQDLVDRMLSTPTTEAAFIRDIDRYFSLDAYLDRMTWISITQNTDAVRQNFYLYAEPSESGVMWQILMWDADISFSNHWNVNKQSFAVEWRHLLDGDNHFSRRLMSVNAIRHAFVDRFEERLATDLSTEALLPLAQALRIRLSAAVDRDLQHWGRSSSADEEWAEIETFLQRRPAILEGFLHEFRHDPELADAPY